MARYRRYRRRRQLSAGQRAALSHIENGRRLSAELGGLDNDVKQFLFSRSQTELERILDAYEKQFGLKARTYAAETLPAWRNGTTQMSGLVAERLFRILPGFMSLGDKLELSKRLWEHTAPSSFKRFVVSPDIKPDDLRLMLVGHLEKTVVPHAWPAQLEKRFDWLAAEDVRVKQELMNAIRQEEARILSAAIAFHVTPLINELHAKAENLPVRATHDFAVGKHRVTIEFRTPKPDRQPRGCLVAGVIVAMAAGGGAALCASYLGIAIGHAIEW